MTVGESCLVDVEVRCDVVECAVVVYGYGMGRWWCAVVGGDVVVVAAGDDSIGAD